MIHQPQAGTPVVHHILVWCMVLLEGVGEARQQEAQVVGSRMGREQGRELGKAVAVAVVAVVAAGVGVVVGSKLDKEQGKGLGMELGRVLVGEQGLEDKTVAQACTDSWGSSRGLGKLPGQRLYKQDASQFVCP